MVRCIDIGDILPGSFINPKQNYTTLQYIHSQFPLAEISITGLFQTGLLPVIRILGARNDPFNVQKLQEGQEGRNPEWGVRSGCAAPPGRIGEPARPIDTASDDTIGFPFGSTHTPPPNPGTPRREYLNEKVSPLVLTLAGMSVSYRATLSGQTPRGK